MKTWRDRAKPIIKQVIKDVGLEDTKALRKALHDAYPFGEREYFPYKVWLDEIKVQKGLKTFGKQIRKDPNQKRLF